ncbi:Ras GTPase activating protein ira2 [Cryptotrichosporon argae]
MPLRRTSAQTFPASSSSHLRREHDAHDALRPSMDGQGSAQSVGSSAGEQKVVASLVARVVNKLPCNSGTRLAIMEQDEGVRTTVDSLVQMSRIRLPAVIHALTGALETLSKYSSSVSLLDAPLDMVQSQLYLLHLLLLCISTSWHAHATMPSSSLATSDLPRPWSDPAPLDEGLARYLLSVLLVYVRMVSRDDPMVSGTASPAPSKHSASGSSWGRQLAPSSGSYSLGTRFIQSHSTESTQPPHAKPIALSAETQTAAISQVAKYTSRLIFYLSASNWNLVLSRIRSRIAYLTTTIEEVPDLVELRLLEWANVDRIRLGQVMQEISSPFLHIKRPAQVAIAVVLRKAILNWIDVYPAEYEALVESNRKLEGAPDVLFDVLHSMSDNSSSNAKRVKAFYPLMAMLLVICPDTLKRLALGDAGKSSGLGKKASFLESLRKGLGQNKAYEACVVCYVDFVRAAMSLSPGQDNSGVRTITGDITNDLKNALFFSPLASEIQDPNIMVDGLVALYRANTTAAASLIFPKLWTDPSDGTKMIAVRACTAIVSEGQRLPWHASLDGMQHEVLSAIRAIIKAQSAYTLTSAPRRNRGAPDLPSSQTDLLCEILNLLTLDQTMALVNDDLGQTLPMLIALGTASSPIVIRTGATRATVAIINHLVASARRDAQSFAVLQASSGPIWHVLGEAGRFQLLAFHSGDPDDFAAAADGMRYILEAVLGAVDVGAKADTANAQIALIFVFVALVIGILEPDIEQTSLARPCLLWLSKLTAAVQAATSGNKDPQVQADMASRILLLDELYQLPVALGRQQQQRAIRRVFKTHARSSTTTVAIWFGLAARARSLASKIASVDADDVSADRDFRRRNMTADIEGLGEEESKEWQNLISGVCSISNVCFYESGQPPTLADLVGKGQLPKMYEDKTDPMVAVEEFLRGCVDSLVSNSLHVRESMKEALGTELPTSLCGIVVKQMSRLLLHSTGSGGITPSDALTTFVEQAISVLKLVVDRMNPGENAGAFQLDMGEFLFDVGQYLHRLGRDEVAMRVKLRFCALIEAVLVKHDVVVYGSAAKLRNALLEWMSEWSVELSWDTEHFYESRLQRDLDLACLRAMILVTDGLVLRPTADDAELTPAVVKSRLFYRYYALLVKVLGRTVTDAESTKHAPSVTPQVARSQSPDSYYALAILILSNLLSANIDVGLKHCLTLGYHEDPSIRTAFMQLLANILQQGTRFGGLNAAGASAPTVYLDAASGSNMALSVALCEACLTTVDMDELAPLLFRIYEANGQLLALIKTLVEREVSQTNHESELFRQTTITTRLLTIFARTYGYNYVRATLQPLIHSLSEKPAECSFELDPSKAGGEDIERNAEHLRLMCQALLDIICSSTPRVPVMFRALCHHIWEVVEDRFPESRHSAVGSFIFLRFFCPAIISPEQADLDVNPDTREIRRALVLITKVIQNLANNVVFGNKEAHMKVLNPFLSENIRQVTKFLSDVSIRPRSTEVAQAVKTYQDEAARGNDGDGDNAVLHRYIFKHRSKIEASLIAMPPSFRFTRARSARPDLEGKPVLEHLRRIADATGPPAEAVRHTPSARSQVYDEFMRHNAGRNTESLAGAFYEGPASQNGRRIFYFIVARVALVDYDLLAYHVFSLLEKVTDFFDLVIDLTDFSPATELPLTWLRRSVQICPPGMLPCVSTLALYNPNSYARKRMRRLISELSTFSPSVGKTVVAASSPAELAEFIPFTSLALPENTLALAYEADHVFTNLLCLSDHEMQVPVVVKLGHDCLQVASWRKQDLTASQKAYIIDVIKLKDIDDIVFGTGMASDHLIIRHSQNESLTFVSRKRNEMAQIIRAARSKLRDVPNEERALRPSDVPGTLLNVAFLNLSASDETLRLGAYNLINELCLFFKYDLPTRAIKVSSGLVIPSNSLRFILSLSEALAVSAPQLTLEFLKEWTIGFAKADTAQKTACLQYVAPWLANLEHFAKPSRDDGLESVKQVGEIVRNLIGLTVVERRRLHLAVHDNVWSVIARGNEALLDIVIAEVLHSALDASIGSEKAECAADILVSLSSTTVRGKVIARLRKIIAQTYLKPSATLADNVAWPEICVLTRLNLALAFSPSTSLEVQLFLPEIVHTITLLLGAGPVLVRQAVYGLLVNVVQSLASTGASGDMDGAMLAHLVQRAQSAEMAAAFGLAQSSGSLELSGLPPPVSGKDEPGVALLDAVALVTRFLGEAIAAGAVSMDCANTWRARWMGLVAATCFQHNPAIQPQALTVLGYLAADEVDDDLVYQVIVALSMALANFREADAPLVIAMLRCLACIIPGLAPESRYTASLFWFAVAVLQLGYIPLFASALELLQTALGTLETQDAFANGSVPEILMQHRQALGDSTKKLDQVCGVNFETDVSFSIVAVLFKGVRHPATRQLAINAIMELLRLSLKTPASDDAEDGPLIAASGVAYFAALLPVLSGSPAELKALFGAAGVEVAEDELKDVGTLNVFDLLAIPDNSTGLLLVTLITTILNTAGSDAEKLVLYRLLAEASVEIPEVVAMAYDSLIPRMMAVVATTSSTAILSNATLIFERAMADGSYSFPSGPSGAPGLPPSESTSSLRHQKSYSASISSATPSQGLGQREQVLEDLGMKGLAEITFPQVRVDRLTMMAKWVAAILETLTI